MDDLQEVGDFMHKMEVRRSTSPSVIRKKRSKIIYNDKGEMECLVNRMVYVVIPGNRRPRWRWVVKIRSDKRIIARNPKRGMRINQLSELNEEDYGPEKLLPKGTIFWRKNEVSCG